MARQEDKLCAAECVLYIPSRVYQYRSSFAYLASPETRFFPILFDGCVAVPLRIFFIPESIIFIRCAMSGKVADRLLLHCSFNSIHYGKQSTKSSCGQTRFKSCVGYSVNPVLLYAFWHSCNCLCGKSGFSLVNREKSRGI